MIRKLLFVLLLMAGQQALGQADTVAAPYTKFKSFPPIQLILPDSAIYTKDNLPKKKPILLMLFNPQCEHCKHETGEILKNIDKFEDIQIVMATSMPFDSMMAFRERFQLANYKNIVVAKDQNFFLFNYFQIHSLPFLAFYDKKKEFISVFEGSLPIERVLELLKK